MSGSHHNSKKGRARDAETEAERLSAADEVAADLRRQVAILAEQVRALGNSEALGAAAPIATAAAEPPASRTAADLPLPPAPRPRPAASAPTAPQQQPTAQEPEPPTTPITRPAESPPRDAAVAAPPAAARETFAERSSHLVESVVTLAELAAVEIRASAEVEAAAVRASSAERTAASSTGQLVVLLERQRNMLAALAAQTERLEQAAAVLRAQIRALQAEREHIADVLNHAQPAP
jgi:hypothetical protein